MHLHRQSTIFISHKECDFEVALRSGVRQGCSLSPALWHIFMCYVLHRLSSRVPLSSLTALSDDLRAQWTVDTPEEVSLLRSETWPSSLMFLLNSVCR